MTSSVLSPGEADSCWVERLFQSLRALNMTDARKNFQRHSLGAYGTVLCLETYIVPVIVVLGVVMSTCTSMVLLRTWLRKKFYSQFLVGVCVSSVGFLITVLINWMFKQGVPVFDVPGLCQMYIFCSHFFPLLTFLLSVTSAMLILYDLTRLKTVAWMNSPGAAKLWVIGLAILAFTVYSYKTWTHGTFRLQSGTECSVIPESEKAMEVLNIFDLLLLLYLPSCCFLVFDVLLLSKTCSRAFITNGEVYKRRHAEVLKIVLCYSVSFHLLVTPRAVSSSVVTFNRYVYGKVPNYDDLAVNQSLQIIFYLFFAVNPIFPFCVSRKFRRNASLLWVNGCSKDITIPSGTSQSPPT